MTSSASPAALRLPPGPPCLPIIGSSYKLMNKSQPPHIAMSQLASQYGDIAMLQLGEMTTIIITHPDLILEAYRKPELSDRYFYEVFARLSKSEGLIYSAYNNNWQNMSGFAENRLWSQEAVAQTSMKHLVPAVDEVAELLGRAADDGESLSVHETMVETCMNMTFRTLFGWPEERDPELLELREALREPIAWFCAHTAPVLCDFFSWAGVFQKGYIAKLEQQRDHRDSLIRQVVHCVARRRAAGQAAMTGFVDTLLDREEAGKVERDTVHALCMDVLAAIPAGVAATVSWLLLIVANRAEVQSRIHEELDQVIGRSAPPPVLEDRRRLPYTFACVAESMRYRTVAPLALPHRSTEDTELGGYLIPANAQVFSSIYAVHHDARFWKDPDEFKPERFLPKADGSPSDALTSPAYTPFGVGIRRCTGDHFAVAAAWLHAARLMHRFRLEPFEGKSISEDEVFAFSIEPKPFSLRAIRRPV